jgi:hypothetical protein
MKLKSLVPLTAAVLTAMNPGTAVFAQQPVVYPAKGQSPQQQQADLGACQQWATGNTGVDPAALAAQPYATAPNPSGGRIRGGARGAALGAIGGAIAGDAGEGAAVGAAVGAAGGGMRQRRERRAQEAEVQQAQQQQAAQMGNWQRAYAACLEGRGYTVK